MREPFLALNGGRTLPKEHAALKLEAGYPFSAVEFVFAPLKFFNVGLRVEFDYVPFIEPTAPLVFQMLQTDDGKFNLALQGRFGAAFGFGNTMEVRLASYLGTRLDYYFHERAAWTCRLEFAEAPGISIGSRTDYYPSIHTGVEFAITETVGMYGQGLAEFHRFHPDEFVYGGLVGVTYRLIQ